MLKLTSLWGDPSGGLGAECSHSRLDETCTVDVEYDLNHILLLNFLLLCFWLQRVREWESRERKKAREFEREQAEEDAKNEEIVRERKHLMDFLEDYEDEKDDSKYYK